MKRCLFILIVPLVFWSTGNERFAVGGNILYRGYSVQWMSFSIARRYMPIITIMHDQYYSPVQKVHRRYHRTSDIAIATVITVGIYLARPNK